MSIHKNENIEEFLIAYILSETDEKTSKEVADWIAESDENREQYETLLKIWSLSENSSLQFDENKAWKNVESRINKKKQSLGFWFRIAASFIIVLGSIYLLNEIFSSKPDVVILFANDSLQNDTLIDQSVVKLNQNSSLEIDNNFNQQDRVVTLSGEAYFDVKRNEDKSFIIHTPENKVEVLGTSFNIRAVPGDSLVSVFVNRGLVRFFYTGNNNESLNIELSEGEKIIYNLNAKTTKKITDFALNQTDIYWVNKKLSFRETNLEKVFTILESIYNIQIEVSDDSINQNLLTVTFEEENVNQVLNVIAETFKFQIESDGKTYKISRNTEEN